MLDNEAKGEEAHDDQCTRFEDLDLIIEEKQTALHKGGVIEGGRGPGICLINSHTLGRDY